jgi:hypothetical protein
MPWACSGIMSGEKPYFNKSKAGILRKSLFGIQKKPLLRSGEAAVQHENKSRSYASLKRRYTVARYTIAVFTFVICIMGRPPFLWIVSTIIPVLLYVKGFRRFLDLSVCSNRGHYGRICGNADRDSLNN